MIRRIDNTDPTIADRITAIQKLAYAVEADLIGFDGIPNLHETVDEIRAMSHLEWLGAFDGDDLAGFIGWADHGEHIDIDRLAIDPIFSRRGHGRALVRAVPWAPMQKVSTGSLNDPAVRLYESEGFIATEQIEIAPGVFITRFELRSDPSS